MNDSTPNSESEISDQIAALQRQVFTLLVVLIIVSGTLTVFLYRQASVTRSDIKAIKPQAMQLINGFKQNQAGIQAFVNQLVVFGQTHPDFRPVLLKYGISPQTGAPRK